MECHPERILYSKKYRTRGINRVGAGKYGEVSVGCTNKTCRTEIAIKKSLDDMTDEYKMIKKAYRIAPRHVSKPYSFVKCRPIGSIIYSEYIDGKTIGDLKAINKNVLYQVLSTLYKFQKHKFRHNDIHLQNVIVEKKTKRAVIVDFGLANTKELSMTNRYGIHPNSDLRYDYHLFLNWVYHGTRKSSVHDFIKKIIPREYLGQETSKVQNFRLRYGVSHTELPSLRQVLMNPYFDLTRSKNLV